MSTYTRINQNIRAKELRVIGADGANLGVISKEDALKHARDAGLDLIEISPKAHAVKSVAGEIVNFAINGIKPIIKNTIKIKLAITKLLTILPNKNPKTNSTI